jgi:hypothetical protein
MLTVDPLSETHRGLYHRTHSRRLTMKQILARAALLLLTTSALA